MDCKAAGSCAGKSSCRAVTMKENQRKDLIATPKFKKVMTEYSEGKLTTPNGQQVNSPKQAEAIAASESGQSYTQKARNHSKYDRYGFRSKNEK